MSTQWPRCGRRIRLSLLSLLCFLNTPGVLWATISDDNGGIESFIDSVAATTYAAAWPTATYKKVSIEKTEKVTGGYDISVRLMGESVFGGDLWLDLVFEFRSGVLHDMRIGGHNAILFAPFETAKALGAFVDEMIREYNDSPGSSTRARRAGAVCLKNPTEHTLKFSYRWGEGEWVEQILGANYNQWYWWLYDGGTQRSPKFYIRFDGSFSPGYTETEYWLERRSTSLPVTCDKSKQYKFAVSGREINLESFP